MSWRYLTGLKSRPPSAAHAAMPVFLVLSHLCNVCVALAVCLHAAMCAFLVLSHPTVSWNPQVLRVVREASGRQRRFLLTNCRSYTESARAGQESTVTPEARMTISVEHADSARYVQIQELSPCLAFMEQDAAPEQQPHDSAAKSGSGGAHGQMARQLAAEHRMKAQAAEALEVSHRNCSHTVSTELARYPCDESLTNPDELQSKWAGASALVESVYSMLCLRGMEGAAALRALAGLPEAAASQAQKTAPNEIPPLSPPPTPVVPVTLAVDVLRDEEGRMVLLQIKDTVWGRKTPL